MSCQDEKRQPLTDKTNRVILLLSCQDESGCPGASWLSYQDESGCSVRGLMLPGMVACSGWILSRSACSCPNGILFGSVGWILTALFGLSVRLRCISEH